MSINLAQLMIENEDFQLSRKREVFDFIKLTLTIDIYNDIKVKTLTQVRGTVQADILKEDQAQNTCIFSTEFALRLMGDVQEYFIKNKVRNFYEFCFCYFGIYFSDRGSPRNEWVFFSKISIYFF